MHSINPLWRTFLFIVLSSLVTASAMIYAEWNNIKNDARSELIYINKLMTSSVKSVFNKNEAMLKILGERLVESGAMHNSSLSSRNLVNNLLNNNPELAGVGLANPSGQLVLTSSNIDRNNLTNLLTNSETGDSFQQALNSDSMIVGRTYFMKALNQWLIPLRYRINNIKGQTVAVMATGLKMDSAQNLWSSMNLPEHMEALIIRKDLYLQYAPDTKFGDRIGSYTKPTTKAVIEQFEGFLSRQTGMDLVELRASNKTVAISTLFNDSTAILTSVNYDPTYEHYTLIITPMSYLYGTLLKPITWLMSLLLLFNVTLYFIFRSNDRIQQKTKHSLKFQSTHDLLTELPNRRYLLNQFNTWADECEECFTVLFIDLDNFKSINDLHGHTIGDRILREVAVRINRTFHDSLNIRQGGDEFIILSRELDKNAITSLCKKCLNEFRNPIVIGHLDFSISASIGIATAPEDGKDVDTLLRKADMAMYEAKRRQSDIYIFSQRLEEKQKRETQIENELIHALERNEFFLVYQPQINAKNHSMIGLETLIRWNSPVLGMVPPDEFISIAESTGLIIEIGLFVLETALNDISDVIQSSQSSGNLRLSVNVSVRQLLNNDFLEQISHIKNQSKSVKIDLVVEVTENLFIEDLDTAKSILEQIQKAGIEVSLDDFGTGYSSLSVLNKLPINELKIDKSFVDEIMKDEQDKQMILSIISLGQSLNIPVLAEGVENKEQADFLAEHGCDLFQGYYFSKPLSKDKLTEYISSGNVAS